MDVDEQVLGECLLTEAFESYAFVCNGLGSRRRYTGIRTTLLRDDVVGGAIARVLGWQASVFLFGP